MDNDFKDIAVAARELGYDFKLRLVSETRENCGDTS